MYEQLANFYDKYTSDLNNERKCKFIMKCFEKYGNKGIAMLASGKEASGLSDGTDIENSTLVIDVGCGTGLLTLMLSEKGFDMTGLDVSYEMLERARENESKLGTGHKEEGTGHVLWLCQDMTKMDMFGSYAAMIGTTDCVNHLTGEKKADSFLKRSINFVDPGGILIFDFLTPEYFEKIDRAGIMVDETDTGTCIWSGKYNAKTKMIRYDVTCYDEIGEGLYERYDDVVKERAYTNNEMIEKVTGAGYTIMGTFDGYTFKRAHERSLRVVVVAKKEVA